MSAAQWIIVIVAAAVILSLAATAAVLRQRQAQLRARWRQQQLDFECELEARRRELKAQKAEAEERERQLGDQLHAVRHSELSRRLASLEDENEELADDLASVKKRYTALREEYDRLEQIGADSGRVRKELSEALDAAKSRLQLLEKDYAVQTDALGFVRELLTAPVADSAALRALHADVADMVRFVSEDVRSVLSADSSLSAACHERFFGRGLTAWAQTRCKLWLQGKTSVAFIGEFSAGKTSIVNRIIGRDAPDAVRLPVSTRVTTAVPTYITGGSENRYEFVTPDNGLKALRPETFRRVTKEVLEKVKGVSSLIKYFVMTLDDSALVGLSILDTPGFNSSDADDAARTLAVVNECDALFWVVDVNAGDVNRSSLKVIKEHLVRPLYMIINQTDTASPDQVAAVEERISATLAAEGVECAGVLRFSREAPLDELLHAIFSIGHDSVREGYLESLVSLLDERVEHCRVETKAAELKCFYLENKSSGLTDAYNEALRSLRRDCEALADMPRFSNSLFGKGDYRISTEKYRIFHNLLDKIGERHGERLRSEYEEQRVTTADLLLAWKTYAEVNYRLRRLRECRDSLIHKSLKLKA